MPDALTPAFLTPFVSPLFRQDDDHAAEANAYHASVAAAYERHGYRLGELTAADGALICVGFARMSHPGDVASKILVLRFNPPAPAFLDHLSARINAELDELQARTDETRARWRAIADAAPDMHAANRLIEAHEAARQAEAGCV